jgi:hypothetical protein
MVGWDLTVVKPVPEAVEAMLNEVFCCSKVEPRVNFVSVSASELTLI